ncbi:MAG: ATP-binding protein [Spirochaetaceae bacterium]|jgi:hypothetical protein|nr:ATP-binding protein [Spirochaetaceae bacterium]
MARRLPLGIQDFAKIRENNFIYVDKTERIYQLINGSVTACFLSRPRRFGKSLLCSTLGAIFEGRRKLFDETGGTPLAINSLEWDWKKHPVIRLDLNAGLYSDGIDALYSVLTAELGREARKQKIELEPADVASQFKMLIEKACARTGEKAAVIIDEYDKPLLASIDKPELFEGFRNALKGFYGVLKSYDEYLRFIFLTGVTKFSHVSIFSDLNHLDDLTLNPKYADLCGITQEELERNFTPEIDAVLEVNKKDRGTYLSELRRFYNGYRFSKNNITVYNPFGILHHFDKTGEFLPYWYNSGTPAFLVKLIAEQKIDILNLDKLAVTYADFSKYDIAGMKAEPLLYQSGYLTITDYDAELNEFILDYPNDEVRASFAKSLMEQYFEAPDENFRTLTTDLVRAFTHGKPEDALTAVKIFLSKIPYDIIKEKENYYQTAVHLIFTMLGLNCRSEVKIASGRIDTLVETKNYVYCFEFKLNGTVKQALAQIDSKEYLLPWKRPGCNGERNGKTLFKIGVEFDHKHHNIGAWEARKENSEISNRQP